MSKRGYQRDYSTINPEMYVEGGRRRKAQTMLAVLQEALGDKRLASSKLLNLGCSAGFIDAFLAPHVDCVVGVDIDRQAIATANQLRAAPNLNFQVEDAMALSFGSGSFDVVVCSQVYEHVPDATTLLSEIRRVLAPEGVCYFAATNRWAIIEQHYFLPFLSWLPRRLADGYLRLTGRGDSYYEQHLGYFALHQLAKQFRVEDKTGAILSAPTRYHTEYMFTIPGSRLAARVWHGLLRPVFPGYIWLLWKEK